MSNAAEKTPKKRSGRNRASDRSPRLWFFSSIAALFISAALFDIWRELPVALHLIGYCLFVVAMGLVLYRSARKLPLPNWGIELLPILKPVSLTLLAISIPLSGRDAPHRLLTGLLPPDAGVPDTVLIDAWITSPAYTGKPPVTLVNAAEGGELSLTGAPIEIAEGSTVTITIDGGWRLPDLVVDGERVPFQTIGRRSHRVRAEVAFARSIAVYQGSVLRARWPVRMIADTPPAIAFDGEPHMTDNFDLAVNFQLSDDYGVDDVVMQLTRVGLSDGAPLEITLAGVGTRGPDKSIHDFVDLTSHVWAGYTVNAQLIARDARGQEAQSAQVNFVLPDRTFTHPVAQRIKEVRKSLMLAPNSRSGPARTLTRIAEQTDSYDDDKVTFLALRSAYYRLKHDKSNRAADEAVNILWDTALNLETNRVSMGRRDRLKEERAPSRG